MRNKGLDIDIKNFNSDKKRKRVYERNDLYLPPQSAALDSSNIACFVPFQKSLRISSSRRNYSLV